MRKNCLDRENYIANFTCEIDRCSKFKLVDVQEIVCYSWNCPICGTYNLHNKCRETECKECGTLFDLE